MGDCSMFLNTRIMYLLSDLQDGECLVLVPIANTCSMLKTQVTGIIKYCADWRLNQDCVLLQVQYILNPSQFFILFSCLHCPPCTKTNNNKKPGSWVHIKIDISTMEYKCRQTVLDLHWILLLLRKLDNITSSTSACRGYSRGHQRHILSNVSHSEYCLVALMTWGGVYILQLHTHFTWLILKTDFSIILSWYLSGKNYKIKI